MARIYLDEDIFVDLIEMLTRFGHDVLHTQDAGRKRATDDSQLVYAAQDQRIIVVHNQRDFRLLHCGLMRWFRSRSMSGVHAGIILIPQHPISWVRDDAAQQISQLLADHPNMTDEMWEFTRDLGWRQIVPDP